MCNRLDGCDTTPCRYVVGSSVYDVVKSVWVVVVCVTVEQVGGEIVHGCAYVGDRKDDPRDRNGALTRDEHIEEEEAREVEAESDQVESDRANESHDDFVLRETSVPVDSQISSGVPASSAMACPTLPSILSELPSCTGGEGLERISSKDSRTGGVFADDEGV